MKRGLFSLVAVWAAVLPAPARAVPCNAYYSNPVNVLVCTNGAPVGYACVNGTVRRDCEHTNTDCSITANDPVYDAYCPDLDSALAGTSGTENTPTRAPATPSSATSKAESASAPIDSGTISQLLEQQGALEQAAAQSLAKTTADLAAQAASASGADAAARAAAKAARETGANRAATIGAMFCAQGALDQVARAEDLAGRNYGSCKQYFDAAGGLRNGAEGPFRADDATLAGEAARGVLSGVEGAFGISGADFLGRLLGANGSADELASLTKSKLKPEAVAKAFDEARAPEGGAGKFEVAFGDSTAKKGGETRAALKAALKEAVAKDGERRPANAQPEKKTEAPRLKNLEPLREGILAEAAARNSAAAKSRLELTLFDVVHQKYSELTKRHDL